MQVSTRRSTVLSLPLHKGFPGIPISYSALQGARKPTGCLGQNFNFKLSCFAT